MKKLKEEVYAMGTMEVIDIRQTNKKVQEYCVCLGGGGSISTFTDSDEIFFSAKYARVKKRNSYTILYSKEGMLRFGSIFVYIKQHPIALVQKLIVIARFKEDMPIFRARKSDEYNVISVYDIKEKCMYVKVDDNNVYVCRFPCKILTD